MHFLVNDIFMCFFFGLAIKEVTEALLPLAAHLLIFESEIGELSLKVLKGCFSCRDPSSTLPCEKTSILFVAWKTL